MFEKHLKGRSDSVDTLDGVNIAMEFSRGYDLKDKLSSTRYSGAYLLDLDELAFQRIQEYGLSEPIRVKQKSGLGIVDPESSLNVSDIRALVGGRRIIDVIDCKTQRLTEMTMREFEQYFIGKDRKYLYHAVSLEISKSKLEAMVDRPAVLDYLDWVDLVWPQHLKLEHNLQSGLVYPKVQRYCMLSVSGCFTDFHIDFGGTSIWHYLFKGEKVVWLIPPTKANLHLYEGWVAGGCQADIFFGDLVSGCQRIDLQHGNSLVIPGGWIYAVYTSKDSIAFSGNFLNSFNISLQLDVFGIEKRTNVPSSFQFPFFVEIHWYALERYVHTLTGQSFLSDELRSKALPSSQTISENKENETSKEHVHITPFEYKGLEKLIDALENFSEEDICIPGGITDPANLLKAGKILLSNHVNDNPSLAITGKPKAFWPQLPRPNGAPKKVKLKPKPKKPSLPVQKKLNSSRIRRIRCKVCEACSSDDCRECVFCKDMRKYGGPGTMKQTCIKRRCTNPILPSSAGQEAESALVRTEKIEPEVSVVEKEPRQSEHGDEFIPIKIPKLDVDDFLLEDAFDDSLDSQYYQANAPVAETLVSRIPSHQLYRYPIPPAPMLGADSNQDENSDFTKDKIKVWMRVFQYLNQNDLASCMLVCKSFLRMCGSPQFWKSIDLTSKSIKPTTLQCLVRRSPECLNFSQTNVSFKQLLWLLERSPSLSRISLEGCSWSAVAALNTASSPSLKNIDISWTAGFTDPHLKYLLSVPKDARPGQVISHSRVYFCEELSLAGTDITDKGLKLLSQQLPHLKSINVSYCSITNDGFGHLTSPTSKCQKLCSLTSQQCPHLNDNVFVYVRKIEKIKILDFRNCLKISPVVFQEIVAKYEQLKLVNPLCAVTR